MLSIEQLDANRNLFLELIAKLPFDSSRLLNYLQSNRVDFFNKPYNTRQEQAYAGSLCEHCLAIHNALVKLTSIYTPDKYTEQQLIEVALLGNLYRAELFEPYLKNVKNDSTGQWESIIAYKNKEIRPVFGDIGFSSYMIAKKFIDLDDEVIEAICYSSLGKVNDIDSYNIRTAYPLVTLTTMAELAITNFKE